MQKHTKKALKKAKKDFDKALFLEKLGLINEDDCNQFYFDHQAKINFNKRLDGTVEEKDMVNWYGSLEDHYNYGSGRDVSFSIKSITRDIKKSVKKAGLVAD